MEALYIGVAIALNFTILIYKFNKRRYADLATDVIILFILGYLFQGTVTGMIAAMVGGALISIYLLFMPPVLDFSLDEEEEDVFI